MLAIPHSLLVVIFIRISPTDKIYVKITYIFKKKEPFDALAWSRKYLGTLAYEMMDSRSRK